MKLLVSIGAFLAMVATASAQDCNKKCCRFGICEPACKVDCEAKKKINPIIPGVSSIPGPPGPGDVEKALQQSCAAAFQLINGYVVATQPAYPAGSERLLNQARDVLIASGVLSRGDFDNISIRWGQLKGHGQAPDRNQVFIDQEFYHKQDLFSTAATLAHEMIHVRQYRRMGSDNFKCEYSKEFVRTRGKQGNEHDLEREAYAFNVQTNPIILQYIRSHGLVAGGPVQPVTNQVSAMCVTPYFTCNSGNAAPRGAPCQCFSPQTGPIQGNIQ